ELLATAGPGEDGGGVEVVVRALLRRAVGVVLHLAGAVPGIPGGGLEHPVDSPAGEVHGDDGIAGVVGGGGVVLAGAHVELVALDVDGRAVPDGRPGGTQAIGPHGVLALDRRLPGDGVGLPKLGAALRVIGHHRAPEGATAVLGLDRRDHL